LTVLCGLGLHKLHGLRAKISDFLLNQAITYLPYDNDSRNFSAMIWLFLRVEWSAPQ
jgi:hypothetical protein